MLIPSSGLENPTRMTSLSRRVNANSQLNTDTMDGKIKLIKKGEC